MGVGGKEWALEGPLCSLSLSNPLHFSIWLARLSTLADNSRCGQAALHLSRSLRHPSTFRFDGPFDFVRVAVRDRVRLILRTSAGYGCG